MTSMQPYEAWFFFGADDAGEVNREYLAAYERTLEVPTRLVQPDLTDRVEVVAAEMRNAMEYAWFIRFGQLECRPAWMLRKVR